MFLADRPRDSSVGLMRIQDNDLIPKSVEVKHQNISIVVSGSLLLFPLIM
jgi:hypothetical protein